LYGRQDEIGTSIAVDNSGNSFVAGYFNDNISLSNSNFISTYGNQDYFVAKFNSNGSPLWLRTGGGAGTDMARGVAVSSTGDAIITGYYQNSANFQGYILSSNASGDAFVEYLDANGNFTWLSSSTGSSAEYANGVAVSSTKSVYITGGFSSSTTFGVNNITSRGGSDMFIAKLISGGGLMQGGAQYKGVLVNRTLPVTTEALVPMNVDWFVYNASFNGNSLEVSWKPSVEISGAFYIVEQSVDGVNYTTLATVAANQVYNPAYTYSATINKAMLANGAIRVRMQNSEGLYAVTGTTSVKLNNNSDISMLVYPNPAKDIFTVQLSKEVNDANVVIYSMDGKVVRNLVLNGTGRTAEIAVSDLASGMYLVKVVANGEVLTKRLNIQH